MWVFCDRQLSWGVWESSGPPGGVLGSGTHLQKFLGPKEYLNWLKTDLDETVQNSLIYWLLFKTTNAQKINKNGRAHIQC